MFLEIKRKIWKWLKCKMGMRSSWEQFKAVQKRKIERKFYKRRYATQNIIDLMKSMGLKKGATIFIHSSWDEFHGGMYALIY